MWFIVGIYRVLKKGLSANNNSFLFIWIWSSRFNSVFSGCSIQAQYERSTDGFNFCPLERISHEFMQWMYNLIKAISKTKARVCVINIKKWIKPFILQKFASVSKKSSSILTKQEYHKYHSVRILSPFYHPNQNWRRPRKMALLFQWVAKFR